MHNLCTLKKDLLMVVLFIGSIYDCRSFVINIFVYIFFLIALLSNSFWEMNWKHFSTVLRMKQNVSIATISLPSRYTKAQNGKSICTSGAT